MADQETYLTIEEVAAHYRTSASSIRWWRHNGYGPQAKKIGGRLKYPLSEIRRFDATMSAEQGTSTTAKAG